MKNKSHFSDEFLNAYLDNELTHADKIRLLDAVREDEQLDQRLCQLQRVHNMVQLAYNDVYPTTDSQTHRHKSNSKITRFATAATVLLFLGGLGGWFTHHYFNTQSGLTEIVQELHTNSPASNTPWKLLVQVSNRDVRRFGILMDETERLLKTAAQNNEQLTIQILANAQGIELLKDDQSPTALRIKQLRRQYNNLLLTACGQSLEKLRSQNRPVPKLLEEAHIVQSAIQQVIEKHRLGWTYIKI